MKRVMKTIIAAAVTTGLTSVAIANTKCNMRKDVGINASTAVPVKAVSKTKGYTTPAADIKGVN